MRHSVNRENLRSGSKTSKIFVTFVLKTPGALFMKVSSGALQYAGRNLRTVFIVCICYRYTVSEDFCVFSNSK